MEKMEKLLRYISGKTFQIEKAWGIEFLQDLLFTSELGFMDKQLLAGFEQSKQINYFGIDNGRLLGNDSNDLEGKAVARITLDGPMMVSDGLCSIGMRSLDRIFQTAYADKNIEGIILEVNTGGGLSSAGDILFNSIKDRNKPVVVYTTFMASAGIKGTLPADEIIAASPGTVLGSIGVMYQLDKSFLEYAKENDISVYSEKSPNKNAEYRKAKQGDFSGYVKMATRLDELFMRDVQKHRPLRGTKEIIDDTLSGAIFDANVAKRRGLIDGVGSFNYALRRLRSHLSY